MLKIGQNWVKLQIIPPNAEQRSASLLPDIKYNHNLTLLMTEITASNTL